MEYVRKYGPPTYFLTMTCNPKWFDIRKGLFHFQDATDRPDIVANVFFLKMKALLKRIITDKVLGETEAHHYVVEFQKRGLPHMHLIIWMKTEYVPKSPSDVDAVISAELPNKKQDQKKGSYAIQPSRCHPNRSFQTNSNKRRCCTTPTKPRLSLHR